MFSMFPSSTAPDSNDQLVSKLCSGLIRSHSFESGRNTAVNKPALIPVVVWLKGSILVQAQILGLLVSQLCKMCVKRWEM